jgi:hypothetical protein
MTKRATKNPPWDDLRVYDDDPAGVTFEIVFGDYVSELYGVVDGETVEQAAMSVCRRFDWIDNPPGAEAAPAQWETLCKRTGYPKLGYIIHRLKQAGIGCKFETDGDGNGIRSFHADNILLVDADRSDAAWEIMGEKWSKATGRASRRGRTTLDDMPDDHPAFSGYKDETPDDDEEAEHDFDPIRDGWVGKDGLP